MRHLLKTCAIVLYGLVLVACNREAPVAAPVVTEPAEAITSGNRGGAISSDSTDAQPLTDAVLKGSTWPAARVRFGEAMISCDPDYSVAGDGKPLVNLGYFSVLDAMSECRERGVVRLHYRGKIASDFTALVRRVASMAARMEIDKRILDIDSSGGQIEDGIRAGDAIGATHWTVWVREDSVCHSACVLVLAAGDNRMISGKVGVHRIIRLASTATTRAGLEQELRAVHAQIKDSLARNGVDVAVADMMMTVPSRDLRLLTEPELEQYGLSGSNAVQDDLERIRLLRKCGEEFVYRRESYARAFDRQCTAPGDDVEAMNACGLALRGRYGFPDAKCPVESPLSEYDRERGASRG